MTNDEAGGLLSTPTGAPIMSIDDLVTSLKTRLDTETVADEAFLERERQYEREQEEREAKRRQDNRASRFEMHNSLTKKRADRFEDGVRQWHTTAKKAAAAENSIKKQLAASLKESQQVPLEEHFNTTVDSPPVAKKEETTLKVSSRVGAPALKSALSTPQKPSLLHRFTGGLFGSGGKKSASFCPSPAVEISFTPPNSDEKERIYGNIREHVPVDILVVANDSGLYKSWRNQDDYAFVEDFNDKHGPLTEPENKKSAMDVLHAARAKRLLRSLDAECLRAVITKVFQNKKFPRLQSKTGESQLKSFLEKVDKVLDDHVKTTKKTQPASVYYDSVFCPDDYENELDHSLSDGEADHEMEA